MNGCGVRIRASASFGGQVQMGWLLGQ